MRTHPLVTGLPKISSIDGDSQGCVLGKNHQYYFPLGRFIDVKSPLELVHSDLMSILNRYFFGVKYVLTFNDNFSRCTWV